MVFTFKVTHVDKLPRTGVGILDGKLLDGQVSARSKAELIHAGQRFPLRLKGVVLDSARTSRDGIVSLSVDLRQQGMSVVERRSADFRLMRGTSYAEAAHQAPPLFSHSLNVHGRSEEARQASFSTAVGST